MKALLTAIKTQLQTDLTYVRDSDVYVTEDENLIPEAVKFPAVGLKDGDIKRTELAGGMWEVTLTITVIVYVELRKPEASIMGDASTTPSRKGVLDMADDVHTSLDENLLGITGMQAAFSPGELGSDFIGDEKDAVQKKAISYQYTLEETRP